MTGTVLFWVIALVLALACFAAVLAPLLRGAGAAEPRSRYAAKLYRDQLRELRADSARGLVTPDEARVTEIEISRRLLTTAEADAQAPDVAPRALSRRAGATLIALFLLAGMALYGLLGAPGVPDQPLVPRLERAAAERANRPRQAEAEAAIARAATPDGPRATPGPNAGPRVDAAPGPGVAEDQALIDRLETILKTRPDDEQGHRLLARARAGMSDWAGAHRAQGEVIRILGDRAGAEDYAEWAELMILATGGYVSPEAEAALGQALTRDPANKLARYYSGLTLLQEGRPDLTYQLWSALLAEGPADAPWIATIRNQIGEVARLAGMPPPEAATSQPGASAPPSAAPPSAAPGPDAADVEAAGEMSPAERQAMIEGMVDQLAGRLASEGGPAGDWARLIRAQGVLGRTDAAQASWRAAREAFATDPEALATIDAAAGAAGLR